jgi:pimeloyl-ACP methyl ester carboxylesterase
MCAFLAVSCWSVALRAQDIAGTWQGTAIVNGEAFRQVFKISRADAHWRVVYYDLDEEPDPVTAGSVDLDGSRLKVAFSSMASAPNGATYDGSLSADRQSLTGTWTQSDGQYALNLRRIATKDAWPLPLPHTVRFISVETNVRLEVLDWGGSGRPLVFLAGLGDDAHVFDQFAPKFVNTNHVYAITRRGFGASSAPPFTAVNYSAARLGDDVLAVLDSLRLARPVLAGHSIAGEELSAVGSEHPERVAGLIYLDAGFGYAFYDTSLGDFEIDRADLQHKLDLLAFGKVAGVDHRNLLHELRDTLLPRFERDLDQQSALYDETPTARLKAVAPNSLPPSAASAVIDGEEKVTRIPVPILALFAYPHQPIPAREGVDSVTHAWLQAQSDFFAAEHAAAFARGLPSARVVCLPNSTHYLFRSNEADVLREMRAFMAAHSQ